MPHFLDTQLVDDDDLAGRSFAFRQLYRPSLVTPWEPLPSAFDQKGKDSKKDAKNHEYEELGDNFIQVG